MYIYSLSRRIFAIVLITALPISSILKAEYRIVVDEKNPLVARAFLQIPKCNGQPKNLVLRGAKWGRETQVSDVSGDGKMLISPQPGKWIVPSNCHEIEWTISFKVEPQQAESLYFKQGNWWLISEMTSILRIEDSVNESQISLSSTPNSKSGLGAIPSGDNDWKIPVLNGPPEFFVVGHANPITLDIEGLNITYISDNELRVKKHRLLEYHKHALSYLMTLFPSTESLKDSDKNLLVVWVGAKEKNHQIGGFAGSRSFVANYLYENSKTKNDSQALGLSVIAHEQFHQLTNLFFKDCSLPTWVNESLAQYYGLKALKDSGFSQQTISKTRSRFINTSKPIEFGLLEISRRYKSGDQSAYSLFYSQGATFWNEIDETLRHSSKNKLSLDNFLIDLLQSHFDENEKLPEKFVDKLRHIGKEKIDQLIDRYVGK